MIIGLDTETTGIDFNHGCRPFYVTFCTEEGEQIWYEWEVNPLTRLPQVSSKDLRSIENKIKEAETIVLHNCRFDIRAIQTLLPELDWPWYKTIDTLIADHLLASSAPHDLTSVCKRWLNIEIGGYEEELGKQVKQATAYARKTFEDWRIASKDDPTMPSVGDKKWKADMWLPSAIARKENYAEDHIWYSIPEEYANTDSAVLPPLWNVMKDAILVKGLWNVFTERMDLLRTIYLMESRGLTYNEPRRKTLTEQYQQETTKLEKTCVRLSGGYLETMPKGVSKDLKNTLFEHFQLPVVKKTEKGSPSADKEALKLWKSELKPNSKAHKFITNLSNIRQRNTAVGYLVSYDKFGLAVPNNYLSKKTKSKQDWKILYPTVNPTGSDTLRFSSKNPNQQNVSKKEGFNLRYAFGPLPNRVWISMDYNNLELRIPAYEAEEKEMIQLFECPKDAPFYGSYHLLVASILHPQEFEQCLKEGTPFKKKYASTLYQWTKNGNFATQYGAIPESGTADRAYNVEGGQLKVMDRFKKITKLNLNMINHANEKGFVWTMFDHDVGGAYPIETPAKEWGRIKPTIPLNYHVQGTAMWAMVKAMNRVQQFLDTQKDYYLIGNIHDEILLDFPLVDKRTIKAKVKKIKRLMEQSGDDIGVPLPVSVEYHFSNWSEGTEEFENV